MSDNGYDIVGRPSEGIILTKHREYGLQIWALARMTKRNIGRPCAMCNEPLEGEAFRPLRNPSNRMRRICHRHIVKVVSP